MRKVRTKTIAQTCDSRSCRKKYKDELSKMCQAVTTVHILDESKNEIVCMECNKKTKLQKS